MARKRGPPKSHNAKYRQIKESGFDVSLPRPDTPAHKAMVTRYHRIIFGGKNYKGKHTYGISNYYKPYKGKHKDKVEKAFPKSKGVPRIGATFLPKGGSIVKASRDSITIKTKYTTEKIFITRKGFDRDKTGRYRIRIASQIRHGTFDKASALEELSKMRDKYQDIASSIHIETVDLHNQASNGDYKKAKKNRSH